MMLFILFNQQIRLRVDGKWTNVIELLLYMTFEKFNDTKFDEHHSAQLFVELIRHFYDQPPHDRLIENSSRKNITVVCIWILVTAFCESNIRYSHPIITYLQAD